MTATSPKRYDIRMCLLTAVSLLILVAGVLTTTVSYIGHRKSVSVLANNILCRYKDHVIGETLHYVNTAASTINVCREIVESDVVKQDATSEIVDYFAASLKHHAQFAAVSYADPSGDLMMVTRMQDGTRSVKFVKRAGDVATTSWVHENSDWARQYPTRRAEPVKDAPDPRQCPWYLKAEQQKAEAWTDVYLFSTGAQPGFTCSVPFYEDNGMLRGVLGIDISLTALSRFMGSIAIEDSTAFIVARNGDIVAVARGGTSNEPSPSDGGANAPPMLANVNDLQHGEIARSWQILSKQVAKVQDRAELQDQTLSFDFSHDRTPYFAAFSHLPAGSPWNWAVGVIVPQEAFLGDVRRQAFVTFSFCIVLILISALLGSSLARNVSTPLTTLARQMGQVRDFRLDDHSPVSSRILELDDMARSFANMIRGLRSFRKYVPADLVRQLVSLDQEARLGGENRCLSIYFSDIAGFTEISEQMAPEELVLDLSEYLTEMSTTIQAHGGTVDKYIGDAVMAFWGAPKPTQEHAVQACRAAIENQKKIELLSEKWQATGRKPFNTRIGINTGAVVVGNIGSEERMNYTIIGDQVNVASRLEGLNKYYSTSIAISEYTYEQAKAEIEARVLDLLVVKGRKNPIKVYNLLGMKGELDRTTKQVMDHSNQAFACYMDRDFDGALRHYRDVLAVDSDDGLAAIFVARCEVYLEEPPSADWNGVYTMKDK